MNPKKTRDRLKATVSGRLLLGFLSLLYFAVITARRALYGTRLFKSFKLPVPVICFGNLSAGGTGKTSTVVMIAAELKKAGYNPAVLIRGYKRKAPGSKLTILAKGEEAPPPEEAGDEALMLFNMLQDSGVPVLVSSDRYHSGLAAVKKFRSDILLMDDGYQFFRLRRDKNVVMINATSPFHRDSLLPLGDLRETPAGLRRAAAVVLSHCEHVSGPDILEIREKVKQISPSLPLLESKHTPESYIDALKKTSVPLSKFRGKKVTVLSAIGDPQSFENAIVRLKADPVQIWRYPDHHQFTRGELSAIQATREGRPLITTYKDFIRFPADWPGILGDDVFILSVEIVFQDDGLKRLMEIVTK
jgi:tetraacyldisaccharide 4'-kinase